MKKSRHDLEMAVGFLETKVSKSDVDKWEKPRRILWFVHYTLKENKSWRNKSRRDIHMGGCIIRSTPWHEWSDLGCDVHGIKCYSL